MTRVLVIGANGMLGHVLMQAQEPGIEIAGTLHSSSPTPYRCLAGRTLFHDTDCRDNARLQSVLDSWRPDVVINAAGIIKQRPEAQDKPLVIAVNALFPHQISGLCRTRGIRLIHISTDCVFSGTKGAPYKETDTPDAHDLYGLTKYLGEVQSAHCLTLRCSIVGLELSGRHGLLEWAIQNRGQRIRGYDNALYTGLTTQEMARAIFMVIRQHRDVSGLYHVASATISKYRLLELFNHTLKLDLTIEKDTTFLCDRRLDGSAFSRVSGYSAPAWEHMVQRLSKDACLHE